jgi:hypothetical protein
MSPSSAIASVCHWANILPGTIKSKVYLLVSYDMAPSVLYLPDISD